MGAASSFFLPTLRWLLFANWRKSEPVKSRESHPFWDPPSFAHSLIHTRMHLLILHVLNTHMDDAASAGTQVVNVSEIRPSPSLEGPALMGDRHLCSSCVSWSHGREPLPLLCEVGKEQQDCKAGGGGQAPGGGGTALGNGDNMATAGRKMAPGAVTQPVLPIS